MKARLLLSILVLLSLLVACDSRGPHRDGPPGPPAGNDRPPVSENRPFDPELKDGVWRVCGFGLNLRYDRGGVLFVSDRSGSVSIIDLDGASRLELSHSGLRPDSLLASPEMTVNGTTRPILEARMMARDNSATWFRLLSPDSAMSVLVIPSR